MIHFETLGCRLNQAESEGAARAFTDSGFSVTMAPLSSSSKVDESVPLCVLNTCTVTAKAEQKARRIIRLLLDKFPNSVLVVTGCYAQLRPAEIKAESPRVCVLPGRQKEMLADLPSLLKENTLSAEDFASFLQEKFDAEAAKAPENTITNAFRLSTDSFLHHSRPSLKIQDGCNGKCTYCAIRLARGKSVSLDAAEVLRRVKELEDSGQNEVVITTVNIGQYVSSYEGRTLNFTGLLELILQETSKIAVRISSLYPEIVDDKFAKVVSNPRVRPHFHISIQSGSDSILSKMKRPYKIETVFKACELLKKAKGQPFLACDIIAGFPGESDDDFDQTLDMLKKTGMTYVHAFPFSARPDTEAYKMRPMVPNSVAGKRISALEEYSKNAKSDYINSFAGKEITAICESLRHKRLLQDKIVIHAVTENFLHCKIELPSSAKNQPKPGELIKVRILRPLGDGEKSGDCDTLAEQV